MLAAVGFGVTYVADFGYIEVPEFVLFRLRAKAEFVDFVAKRKTEIYSRNNKRLTPLAAQPSFYFRTAIIDLKSPFFDRDLVRLVETHHVNQCNRLAKKRGKFHDITQTVSDCRRRCRSCEPGLGQIHLLDLPIRGI
jgi:hypothetical protein